MKKNFLTAVAFAVTAFFAATEIAQAADVSFSGQLRSRYENDDKDFDDKTSAKDFVDSRVRLNAKVNINDETSAFIQLQSVNNWGSNSGARGEPSGSTSFAANDTDSSVGIHQAYFTLKNFGLPADLKVGRQEVVLDGHRLFGSTGWTEGAQTHDAVRLTHKAGNHTLAYAYILGSEGGASDDVDAHLLYANFQGVLGGGLSLYLVDFQDSRGIVDNDFYTTGFRQAGKLFGLDYRVEYYHQSGDATGDFSKHAPTAADNTAAAAYVAADDAVVAAADDVAAKTAAFNAAGTAAGTAAAIVDLNAAIVDLNAARTAATVAFCNGKTCAKQDDVDRDAHMFGVRIGKKFNNVAMKPSLTLWYDELSGTDSDDRHKGDWSTFNTLFDTGHKFYGHMDLFLNGVNGGTKGYGLVDTAIKASIQPMPGWTVKAAYHWFETEADYKYKYGEKVTVTDELGEELDLAVIHKHNANTTLSAGYSMFDADDGYHALSGRVDEATKKADGDDADWVYVQLDVKF